jgi:hypothetical protein
MNHERCSFSRSVFFLLVLSRCRTSNCCDLVTDSRCSDNSANSSQQRRGFTRLWYPYWYHYPVCIFFVFRAKCLRIHLNPFWNCSGAFPLGLVWSDDAMSIRLCRTRHAELPTCSFLNEAMDTCTIYNATRSTYVGNDHNNSTHTLNRGSRGDDGR